jgi:hypothetical protein
MVLFHNSPLRSSKYAKVMKRSSNFLFCLILMVFTSQIVSCTKDIPYNGNVAIAASYNTHVVPQAKIYFKQGSKPAVPLTPDQYKGMLTADSNGQATFYDLTPGSYYFYATGFSPEAGRAVQGDTVITVLARYRAESDFTILLNVK